jgi:hypothetical protein
MSEIRITRSAGQSWNTKYAPGVQNPDNLDTASLEQIQDTLANVGPLNQTVMPDTPDQPDLPDGAEIRVTRSAGQSWNTKYAPGAQTPNSAAASLEQIQEALTRVGPMGPPGTTGTPAVPAQPASLLELTDVLISGLSPGDVLRYANNKWRNYNETQLTDGGNF